VDSLSFTTRRSSDLEAVQLGTAFLTTEESGANLLHKQMITESSEDNIVVTKGFSGKAARGVRNEFIEKIRNFDSDILPYPLQNTDRKSTRLNSSHVS